MTRGKIKFSDLLFASGGERYICIDGIHWARVCIFLLFSSLAGVVEGGGEVGY